MIDNKTLNKPVNRIWILGDMHLGVRSNSMEWLDIQKDFFENQFIPTLKKYVKEGDILVQVGDYFDNRQSINIKILNYAIKLAEQLGEILPVFIITGNHDIWAKKTNEITSIDSLKWVPNVQIYKKPQEFNWHGRKTLLMPWRKDVKHEQETLQQYPDTELLFCHSEVQGIKLNAKVKNMHGTTPISYNKFTAVYSGHIHYRQSKGKLNMVGTPYELTRSDANNIKGFDLLDLDTMQTTFFENKRSPKFLKNYLHSLYNVTLEQFKKEIKNNFVDLYVPSEIASTNALSKLIHEIQGIGRKIEPTIYDESTFIDKDINDMDEIEDLYKNYNILHLCNTYIEGLAKDKTTKSKIKERIKALHDQCVYNYNDLE